jgi:hypothetical protein
MLQIGALRGFLKNSLNWPINRTRIPSPEATVRIAEVGYKLALNI